MGFHGFLIDHSCLSVKFLSNFHLAVTFFLIVMCLFRSLDFYKAKKKSSGTDYFDFTYRWQLNNLEAEHLKLAFKTLLSLSVLLLTKNWRSQNV